ncbi:MAG: acetolactate synthase small subunit [Syntrophaceae bacterium]|nr:acetolactate synthase small subunit [Syntrophaceae bacterium]
MTPQLKERAIAILANNQPDVLARIAATLSARGFNIESISANVTRNPDATKIVITLLTTPETISKVLKHLARLVDVLDVRRVRREPAVWRELILARIALDAALDPDRNAALQRLLHNYSGRIVSRDAAHTIAEFTGDRETVEEILRALEALGVEDLTRSGVVALEK